MNLDDLGVPAFEDSIFAQAFDFPVQVHFMLAATRDDSVGQGFVRKVADELQQLAIERLVGQYGAVVSGATAQSQDRITALLGVISSEVLTENRDRILKVAEQERRTREAQGSD